MLRSLKCQSEVFKSNSEDHSYFKLALLIGAFNREQKSGYFVLGFVP